MPLYEFEGMRPEIDPTAWIAPSSDVIGSVRIGAHCYVGWQSVLRGDNGRIIVEEGAAVEEGVIIHTRPGFVCRIGREATIGHGAVLHNATIGPFALIGMRAIVSNFAQVGEWAIVGEMGLVRNNQIVPPFMIALGQPVEIVGPIKERHQKHLRIGKNRYKDFTDRNRKGLRRI